MLPTLYLTGVIIIAPGIWVFAERFRTGSPVDGALRTLLAVTVGALWPVALLIVAKLPGTASLAKRLAVPMRPRHDALALEDAGLSG